MKAADFKKVLDDTFDRISAILGVKAAEYASDRDHLHNFKQAAKLRNVGIPQALGGIMVKHTISIFDMIESGQPFPQEKWDEKIIDHINYLILLRACLIENAQSTED